MDKPKASPATGAKQQIEKQARQLAYDTRYKVKQSMSAKSGARLDPAAVRKAYMSQLGKSSAAPAVKARAKQMLLGEDLINPRELANESLVSALYKVFVEGVDEKKEEIVEESGEPGDKKYKIRVTDKKTGNTYVRMATREKIRELRANSNIASVEMTGYGEVSDDEKKSGKKTAAAKAGKDYDGDGKIESGAKEYRGVIHNAIQRKKGLKPDGQDTSSVKEGLIYEKEENTGKKKITGEKVDNYKSKAVKVSPDMHEEMKPGEEMSAKQKSAVVQKPTTQQVKDKPTPEERRLASIQKQRLMAQLKQVQSGEPLVASYEPDGENVQEVAPPGMEKTVRGMKRHPELSRGKTKEGKKKNIYALAWYMYNKKKGVKEEAECGCDDEPKLKKSEGAVEDPREIPTKTNLVKNKLRAMGLKMSYEPEGEVVNEGPEDRVQDERLMRGGLGAGRGSSRPPQPSKPMSASEREAADKRRKETSRKAIAAVMAAHGGPKNFM